MDNIMFLSLSKDKTNKLWALLWDHQKDAIEEMVKYIKNYRENPTDKSALVQMPTGSGKSGIIAVLSTYTTNVGLTLVLTPRSSLRDQLSNDINGRFYNNINFKFDKIPKEVVNIKKGSELILKDSQNLENLVIVMTFNMLQSIANRRESIFNKLKKHTSLLLVDEGHYEPANTWSKLVRNIKVPKILFTATPYRNDFQVFDIDLDHIYTLSFQSAVKGKYIRDIEIIERTSDALKTPDVFIDDILKFYNQTFPDIDLDEDSDNDQEEEKEKKPRIIIRCDESISIKHLAKAFEDRNIRCVGIHDTFDEKEDWQRKSVPKSDDTYAKKAIVWIHQFKLMEGIDDSRFQVLSIKEPIRSARALVQQIGRILRNPNREGGAKGYFLEHWDGFHKHLWDGFLKYDNIIKEEGSGAFLMSTGRGILDKLLENQPKITYVNGKFCSKFDFNIINIDKDIQIPLRVNIFKKLYNFDIGKFLKYIEAEYRKQDRVVELKTSSNKDLRAILSVRCKSSPFLRNHTFIEADLYITIIWESKKYIFIYDSSGMNWIKFDSIKAVDVDDLKKFFRYGNSSKLTKVTLSNSNLATSVVRSRTITAASIEATIPSFDDYAQICTTAEGYSNDDTDERIRRYIGFTRGRISQYHGGYIPLFEYFIWLKLLYKIIESKEETLPIFSRYALEKEIPEETEPCYILLNIEEIRDVYITTGKKDLPLEVNDTCSEVRNGEFEIIANGKTILMKIFFDSDKNKYILISPDLESHYRRKADAINFDQNILRYFNDTKSFSVLPKALNIIYANGTFYCPKIKVGSEFNEDAYVLGNCFIPDNNIGSCASEKGSTEYYENDSTNWDPNSLFGIISRLGENTNVSEYFGNPSIIICDDMGTEIADFILCNIEPPRIIFIHAKAIRRTDLKCSASHLHEVCAQAIKNLGYLTMFNDDKPSKLNSWDGPWNYEGYQVDRRIFRADLNDNAQIIWNKIRRIINNPLSEKEVWLFLGNILSRKHFEDNIKDHNPRPNVIQAVYLLHATMANVASVGAKLRIFCKE